MIYSWIQQRRKQMILHSIIYYRMGTSIISDTQFDAWAKELVELQQKHPEIAAEVPYADLFKDWDGTTGFHLLGVLEMYPKAEWIVEYHAKEKGA